MTAKKKNKAYNENTLEFCEYGYIFSILRREFVSSFKNKITNFELMKDYKIEFKDHKTVDLFSKEKRVFGEFNVKII